jgi:hypothetical protein
MTYPPEPWYLGGSLLASAFLVDGARFRDALPAGRRPVRFGSRIVVGVASASYVPGGALAYEELLVAVPTWGRGGLRITIPQIWVDSAQSRDGGRALWGIPKELAVFERSQTQASMNSSDAVLSSHEGRALLPGMRQVALPILQPVDGGSILSRNRVIGRIRGLRARWSFAADGPLGYLADHQPFFSFAVRDASIIFGMDVQR